VPDGPAFVDLFCGAGGLSLGFLLEGFNCLLAVDNDPSAVACYNTNLRGSFDRGAFLYDLSRLDNHEAIVSFLELYAPGVRRCDVVVGGPPCQGFSVVGKNKIQALVQSDNNLEMYWKKRNEERCMLYESFAMFIEVLEPRWFLFENVPAIMGHDIFPSIIDRFSSLLTPDGRKLDYRLVCSKYIASSYGVPQNRKRFIMIGRREDIKGAGEWKPPETGMPVTVLEALGDLPPVREGHRERVMFYPGSPAGNYQHRMREGMVGFEKGIVYDHICRTHNKDDVALFARMSPGSRFADSEVQRAVREINPEHKLIKYSVEKFRDKLHRLRPDEPAWTVTAHLQKDCYKFIHYNQPRTVTVREAARLQSFPDRFVFTGISMITSFRLTGNAVPPLMAAAFARGILDADVCLNMLASRRSFQDIWNEPAVTENWSGEQIRQGVSG
jgi:DNA (cytosine-5)-methyltransferase 1